MGEAGVKPLRAVTVQDSSGTGEPRAGSYSGFAADPTRMGGKLCLDEKRVYVMSES